MTKEQAIEWLKSLNYCDGEETQDVAQAIEMGIKALEQQPSDDEITITMNKGTLKYSGQGYVAYNKDWFRKHFATEVKIMTGYDGYTEKPTFEDCVSRADLLKIYENRFIELQKAHQTDKQLGVNWCINTLKDMPPVTPTFPKGETNGDIIKAIFPNAKIDINEMLGASGIVFVDSENEIIPISQD